MIFLSNTNGQEFDNVNAGAISEYKTFDHIIDIPAATMIKYNGDTAYTGFAFNPSYITSGKYTLQIIDDSNCLFCYSSSYIQE